MKAALLPLFAFFLVGTAASFSPVFADGPSPEYCQSLGLPPGSTNLRCERAAEKAAGKRPHVDVCDELGLSGLTISSDDNCLVINGTVAFDFAPTITLYGGFDLPGTVEFTTPDDLNAGPSVGAEAELNFLGLFNSAGDETGFGGVVVDINHGSQEFTSFPGDFIDWTSGTVGLRYAQNVTDKFSIFGGFGAGIVAIDERYPTGGTGIGGTTYVEVGAKVKVNDTFSLIMKGEYDAMPTPIDASNGSPVSLNQARATIGLQFATGEIPHLTPPR